MHSLFTALCDLLFPLSANAARVRDISFATLEAECSPRAFQDVVALASYRAPLVRACIHEAKFNHNERAIALLGQLLGTYLAQSYPRSHPSIAHIIPIPLSAKRLRERGYNQTLDIAHAALAHAPHLSVHETLLKKIRHTLPQTSFARAERLQNLIDVFAIDDHTLSRDARLILFDDVVTTGSTLAEASRTLQEAGFTHIEKLALAH